jgi:multiple sugar transport system substrate-binding protein/putative spermidine/putrescine transport system substrate-binding protein
MRSYLVVAALLGAWGLAWAQAPLRFAKFDPTQLTPQNFEQTLAPLARKEGKLVLYNTAGNFDTVWKTGLVPAFEARYGVRVAVRNVKANNANQQLMAVHKAGVPSPVDVYFAGNPASYELLRAAGVVAGLSLADVLPNLTAVPDAYKRVVSGIDTHGSWPIVHRNQTTLAYDGVALPTAQLPQSFDALLAWAQRHPKKLAITSPNKGGSGSGFLYAAALNFTTDPACLAMLRSTPNTPTAEAEATRWAAQASCLRPLWAYMTQLLKVAELTNGNADTLNLLNNRQVLIGTSWEDLVQTFVEAKQLPPETRQTLLAKGLVSSGDGLIVPANARSPAAALLFINMAFGREFQVWKLQHHASRSPRGDIDPGQVVSAQTAQTLVPAAQMRAWSVPANWLMTQALVKAFEEQVLPQL